MNFKKRVNGSWVDTPNYIHKTDTDIITALPTVLYPNGATASIGLKGNTVQNGTPTPQNPIQPQECGDRTAQLWDIGSWDGATAQRGTLERVTNGYKLTATSNDAYTITYGSGAYSYGVIGGNEYTISWTVDNPLIYGVIYIFTGTRVADTPLTTAVAASGSKTFTVPNGHNYVAFRLGVSNIGDEITYTNIMLNLGSTALPYEPYGYKIPISSANTTTPVYLGEVETTRKIKKLVLTGEEETWSRTATNAPYTISLSDIIQTSDKDIVLFTSSHYLAVSNNAYWMSYNACITWWFSDGVNIRSLSFRDTNQTTLADFKSYLAQQYAAGTPVTIWYVLANETTDIVNEPIRKIGDYADTISNVSIPVTEGADTLSVDTTLQPSEVTVSYRGWHPAIVHERTNDIWT